MSDAGEIRNTLARFCQCLDDRRFEEFSQTFAEDGSFNDRVGRDTILKWIQGAELATRPELKRKHAIVNSIISVHGDRAQALSDLVMFDQVGSEPWTIRVGRYTDELVRQPSGEWLISKRHLAMLPGLSEVDVTNFARDDIDWTRRNMMQVGFIGLGHMGQHMARHVAEAGHAVAAFDLRAEAVAQLTQTKGARRASSVAEAALESEVVFTSLPGPPEVEAVALGPDGLLESMRSGRVYVDLSSNSPAVVRKLCAAFGERGVALLDAPVAGGVEGAEAGTLSVMVGGDRATFDRVKPVLDAIGTKVFYCGPSGNGAVVKLCNNLSSQAQIAAAGEILSLGVKAGVDLETLAGVIGVSTGTCRAIVQTFPRQLFQRKFENPGFSSILSAKDTHLAIELAHELGVPMPIGEIVERDKQEALRRGWGPLSPDVFVRLQEERAGVVLEIASEDHGSGV